MLILFPFFPPVRLGYVTVTNQYVDFASNQLDKTKLSVDLDIYQTKRLRAVSYFSLQSYCTRWMR